MDRWYAKARADAIIGSCARSLPSVKGGCLCYIAFPKCVLSKTQAQALPPTLDKLLAWSGTSQCADTFSNYWSYLTAATSLACGCVSVFENDALKKAKRSIHNRESFKRRERMFIQLQVVSSIVMACCIQRKSQFALGHVVPSELCVFAALTVRGDSRCARLRWVGAQRGTRQSCVHGR